jgi:hypothetical protein
VVDEAIRREARQTAGHPGMQYAEGLKQFRLVP